MASVRKGRETARANGLQVVGKDDVEEMPVFDFSTIGWKEEKKMTLILLKAEESVAEGKRLRDSSMMEEGFAVIEGFIARSLVSVPRSWLVKDAPEITDWSDANNLDYLQGVKMARLQQAFVEAKAAASGKSPTQSP
jgi:hypothetical protein